MTTTWILNTVGVFMTMLGAFLIFLHLWRTPRLAEEWLAPGGKLAYAKHRRMMIIGVGLLAAWVTIQYLAIVFL